MHTHKGCTQINPRFSQRGQGLGRRRQREPLLPSASDYVCVLDVDLLELVIKTWKGSTEDKLVSVAVAQGPPEPEQVPGKGAFGGSLFPTHRLSLSAPWAWAQVPVTASPSLWLLALLGRARPLVDIPPYEPCQQRAAVATKKQGLRSQPFWVPGFLICKREIPGPASLETGRSKSFARECTLASPGGPGRSPFYSLGSVFPCVQRVVG